MTTIDITGPRVTATLPPPTTPPVELDVTAVAPTLPPPDQQWTAARVQRSIRALVTSLVPLGTDQRLTRLGGYLVLLGRVLGALLLGLAVLAIRAPTKRKPAPADRFRGMPCRRAARCLPSSWTTVSFGRAISIETVYFIAARSRFSNVRARVGSAGRAPISADHDAAGPAFGADVTSNPLLATTS